MSGHSKWHSIKHKKGALDAKRGRLFTKLLKEVAVAARMGGSDVDANPRLRTAVQAAKDANMAKDTLERAIKKGAGELEGVNYEDFALEGYASGGVALIITGSTDNKNRTLPEIRYIFTKHGGNLGEVGCVGFMFDRKGVIIATAEGKSEDEAMEIALEAGAEDFEGSDGVYRILTAPNDVQSVREAIEAKGMKIDSAKADLIPKNSVRVEARDAEKVLKLIAALEDHDDVNSVAANYDIDPELIEQFSE